MNDGFDAARAALGELRAKLAELVARRDNSALPTAERMVAADGVLGLAAQRLAAAPPGDSDIGARLDAIEQRLAARNASKRV